MHTVTAALLLTARLYSVVDVPATDRIAANQVAARILRTAGIEMAWTDCNDRSRAHDPGATNDVCLVPPQADELIVRFVSSPAANGPRVRMGGDTLGDAYVDTAAATGSLATVYVDRVRAIARAASVDVGTLLGRVIAHEIGHLLLGTATHRASGLMRAEWTTTLLQRSIPNDWRFSAIDAAHVREGLMRRARCPASYQPTACPLTCSSSQALSGAK
jgi:hypothetical protein